MSRRWSTRCLALAAKGHTSGDIAPKLALAGRTINFHFSNIAAKLAVANRQEAIAVAIAGGIIKL
jgi:DNA-binding CsgD family transcriptional regulator